MDFKKIKNKFLSQKKNFSNKIRIALEKLKFSKNFSLYDFLYVFYKNLTYGAISIRAASIAYNLFLALVPIIIFVFTLLPYIPIKGFTDYIINLTKNIVPYYAYKTIEPIIIDLLTNKQKTLLSIVFLTSINFSINSISALISAFNAISHIHDKRPWWQKKIISFFLLFFFLFIFFLGFLALTLTDIIYNFLKQYVLIPYVTYNLPLITSLKWIFVFLSFYVSIFFLFFLAPKNKIKKLPLAFGTLVTTILCMILTYGFSFFIGNAFKYNIIYGSLATIVILLIWLYFNAISLIIGYEICWSLNLSYKKNSS